ncbi:MAG TPA: GFA family protein [Thermohalobaculum sp.]|nr:GFA family protein [Thermohalobaculum sp.]
MNRTGQCLCGAVQFSGTPVGRGQVSVCHCGQCRRWNSGPLMSLDMDGVVTLTKSDALVWYKSSDHGERGFCRHCGSGLFWREPGATLGWGVSVGALDDVTGVQIAQHIWIDDKPDFYDFADDAPRKTAAQCVVEGE